MEDKIKSDANKAYYQKKKLEKLQKELVEAKKDNTAAIKEQLLVEKAKQLDLPEFLGPFLKLNKRSICFITPGRDDLLKLCMLIVEHGNEIRECYEKSGLQ